MKKLSIVLLALGIIGVSVYGVSTVLHDYAAGVEKQLRSKIEQEQQVKVDENQELYNFIEKVMDKVKANVSPSKKDILINKILGVANKFFTKVEDKQSFVIILSIESKFNQGVKSPVGAVGVGQLMPQFFKDFAKTCNLKVNQEDINDIDVNLAVSACHFNQLIKENGSTLLAVAAYNAGLYSHAVKGLKKLTVINQETSNYVARFAFVQESVGK